MNLVFAIQTIIKQVYETVQEIMPNILFRCLSLGIKMIILMEQIHMNEVINELCVVLYMYICVYMNIYTLQNVLNFIFKIVGGPKTFNKLAI